MKIFAAQAAVAINRARMFHNATTDPQTGISNQNLFLKPVKSSAEHKGNRLLKEVGKIFKKQQKKR